MLRQVIHPCKLLALQHPEGICLQEKKKSHLADIIFSWNRKMILVGKENTVGVPFWLMGKYPLNETTEE